DISSFLRFEQELIALNGDVNASLENAERYDSFVQDDNYFSNSTEEFYLQRLIVQGDVKDTYGASDVVSHNSLHILCYSSPQKTKSAYDKLSNDPSLTVSIDKYVETTEYAEQDYDYSAYENWGAEAMNIGGYRQFLADYDVDKEVVVVVLDTGINTSHPMFEGRLLTDENGKIKGFSYYQSKYQYSYENLAFDVDDTRTPDINEGDDNKYSFEDDNGHGAHVAGIITSLTPDNVKILPIKIGAAGGTSTNAIILSAYLRVLNIYSKQYNVVCTNLSFSGAGKDSEDEKNIFNEQAYEPLMAKNILSITAAGNESTELNVEGLKSVVVSALGEKKDNQTLFDNIYSNYGKLIDISAPGTDICSAGIADTDSADSSMVLKTGTSMASPQVAGIVALLYLDPNLPSDFTADDIEQTLYDNALDMGATGYDTYYGHGATSLKYFEVGAPTATLSFYRDDSLVVDYTRYEPYDDPFTLKIECSDPEFDIYYASDMSCISLSSASLYSSPLAISKTLEIYAIGLKVVDGQIVARTDMAYISYFDNATPLEECFTITSSGVLTNYIGHFKVLTLPSSIDGITVKLLAPKLFEHTNIESITLPDTIDDISGYAFKNCENLKYIYAPGVQK
ncbi:MAG: S8 family serine peptidase, partial [Clostridia bacterium]|nr:S8 family serine peptidase [Clostridia bacterium]